MLKNASFYVTNFLPILPFDVSLGKNYVKIKKDASIFFYMNNNKI